MSSSPECGGCSYWYRYEDASADEPSAIGECRRHAPTMIAVRADDPRRAADFESVWPYTSEGDWCGESPYFEASPGVGT